MRTVAIVGVGLIGGSFALALRKAGFSGKILGVSSARTLAEALARGVVDEVASLEEAAGCADLIYLSQPISRILETLPLLDAAVRPSALVTDAGSTKAAIVRVAASTLRRAQFLGGHPMAGKESRGVGAAEAGLFRGRTYVLTPTQRAELETPAAREFLGWVERIGGVPLVLDPDEHDRIVALTSHLPQLASTALAAALAARLDSPQAFRAAGPGLRDTTRLALSPYEIWGDILATNTAHIREALSAYLERLEMLRRLLDHPGGMREQFEAAGDFARRLRAATSSSCPPHPE